MMCNFFRVGETIEREPLRIPDIRRGSKRRWFVELRTVVERQVPRAVPEGLDMAKQWVRNLDPNLLVEDPPRRIARMLEVGKVVIREDQPD
jgi:hypothetical protein